MKSGVSRRVMQSSVLCLTSQSAALGADELNQANKFCPQEHISRASCCHLDQRRIIIPEDMEGREN